MVVVILHLHADDGVDEEEHGQKEADVGQRLERLHESPEQNADGVALPQKFDEARRAEKAKEADIYEPNIVKCFLPEERWGNFVKNIGSPRAPAYYKYS